MVFVHTAGMRQFLSILLFGAAVATGCKKNDSPAGTTRSFYMGTTPWPADFTTAELDTAYAFINNHCDLVSHHFDDGIPYEEAYYGRPMPSIVVQEIQTRTSRTAPGKKVLLSVAVLDHSRLLRAGYYSNAPASDSIKNFWRSLAFDDPRVVTACVNWICWLIDQLHPAYVNYGVESNSSLFSAGAFQSYKNFLQAVYAQLKARYPALPFFVSFMVDESTEGLSYAAQLLSCTDYIGLSAYPYVSVSSSAGGNTDPHNFPANYFERFTSLDPSRPLAFAETGYIAQNLLVPAYSLNKQGTPAWQDAYLQQVLAFCEQKKARLFVWFCSKDYDAGNNTLRALGLFQDFFMLWQDTGLKDEQGRFRPAAYTWLNWMQKAKE